MASDDYDWGDDFLDGDFDFDFDFDGNKNQGFLKSVSKGFFSSLKSNTIGDTDAKVKTLRRILPKSFGTTFDFYRDLDRRKQEAFKEFKENSADLMGDLAFLSGNLSNSLRDRLPNKIVDGLEEFSKKDFSDWEKEGEYTEPSLSMETVDDDMQRQMLESLEQQSLINMESTDILTTVMTGIGSKQLSAGLQNNEQLYEVNANLRRIHEYQMKIHGQREAMKLSLMTRQFLTSAKYYKFMEAAQHRMIAEMKLVSKNTGMSDFEKTSLLQASKGRLRDNILKTTFSRSGGFGAALGNIISKDSVNESLELLGSITGDLRMASEMTEGAGISTGEMIGSMLGQLVVEKGPMFFETAAGKKLIARVRSKYPEQSRIFDKRMKELREFGDTLSYSTKAMGSVMGRHYQETGMMELPDQTYEEYVADLPANRKPMPKAVWVSLRKASQAAGGMFNLIGENYQESQGSMYQIQEKSLGTLKDASVWSVHDSRSVTEEIPALLSEIHHSLEKIRTGDDNVQKMRYDYRTSRLTTTKALNKQVERMITPAWELNSYADASKSIVKDIDKDGTLSESATNALAHRLAREADKGNVFNPYDYIGMGTDEYLNEDHAKEIEALIRSRFGITDDHIARTQENTMDGLLARLQVPTAEGKELLHNLSLRTDSLKNYTPNVASKIDLIRSLGLDEGLKEAGYISVDPNTHKEVFNQELIWKQLHNQITGKGLDLSLPTPKTDNSAYPTRSSSLLGSASPFSLTPPSPLPVKEEVQSSLTNIINTLVKIQDNTSKLPSLELKGMEANVNLDPMLELMRTTNSTLASITDVQLEQLTVLKKLRSVSTIGSDGSDADLTPEQRNEEREKQGLLDRLRAIVPSDVFNKGVEALIANKPMVLGGLLGGLSMTALSNPKAAALLAGGAMAATMYGKLNTLSKAGNKPGEDEDIYDEDGNEILLSSKKNAGDYYDQASKKIIKSWGDIKGTVIDISKGGSEVAASAKRLAGKIFGPDGREIMLDGLHQVQAFIGKVYNKVDPFGRARSLMESAKTELDQLDVFRAGESDPVLTRRGFKNGWYYDADGNEIKGWKDIKGPVYDQEGNELVSVQDLNDGLKTIGGVSISAAQSAGKKFSKFLGDSASWVKENGRERLGSAILGREAGPGVSGGGDRYEPITERLDSIYGLIAGHWGLDTKMPGISDPVSPKVKAYMDDVSMEDDNLDGEPDRPGVRLNSLADKIRKKKEAKQAQFQDSVIDIADSLSPKDDQGKPKKDGGILGSLLGLAGGGLFAMFKKFMQVGISGFSSMMKLNGVLGKGLLSLGKMLSSALLGRKATDVVDDIGGLDGSGNERDDKKGKKGRRGKRSRFGKFSKLGKMSNMTKLGLGGALTIGGGYAIDAARDWMDVEEGSTADTLLDYGSVGLDVAGYAATASAVAGMAGTSLGGIAAAAAPFLLNPVTLGVAGVGLAGYAAYKYFTASDLTLQQKLRMAQYGIDDQEEELINEILKAEKQLGDYVQFSGQQANFSNDAPLQRIMGDFFSGMKTEQRLRDSLMWFKLRFKPIFMMYQSALRTMNINTLADFDQMKKPLVAQIAKKVSDDVAGLNPPPYSVQYWINADVFTLTQADTLAQVNRYLKEIKEEYETFNTSAKKLNDDLSIQSVESNIKASENMGMLDSVWSKMTGTYNDREDQAKTDSWFKQPDVIKGIDISDMLPGDQPVALVTAYRLAAYGNEENMPWRVEAVLKLERWMEKQTSYSNGKATFTGSVEDFWNAFSMSFRITSKLGREHAIRWFEYRFLPVYLAWFETCRMQRGGDPSKVWKTLSATAQFRFAQRVSELRVLMDEKVRGLFTVAEAPFEGETSEGMSTRAKRLLQALEMKANEARLKDPDMEARQTVTNIRPKGPDSVYSRQNATTGLADSDLSKGLRPAAANSDNPGLTDAEYQKGDFKPTDKLAAVNVDTTRKYETDVRLKPGDDKGVSLNKDQITKTLIQEMVKQGFDDPRQIAEMLALTDYETGGYKKTAENMRYTNAYRARDIFRKLKRFNIPQVQEIIRQGPVAFANAVYNGWLGNTDSPNDGWLYRGRGLVQLTGKDNYEKAAADLGIDIVNNPKMVSEDPETMAKTAIWFFKNNPQMQSISEHGDFNYAARGLNGGKNLPGMEKREALYKEYLDGILSGKLTEGMGPEPAPADSQDEPHSTGVANNGGAANDPMANADAARDKVLGDESRNDRIPAHLRKRMEQRRKTMKAAAEAGGTATSDVKQQAGMATAKPDYTPTMADTQAQAAAAVKQNHATDAKELAKQTTNVKPFTPPKSDIPDLPKTETIKVELPPMEPMKVDVSMKPEAEAAIINQNALLQGILNAINTQNEQTNRRQQQSVTLS